MKSITNNALGKWCRNRERNVEIEGIHGDDGKEEGWRKKINFTIIEIQSLKLNGWKRIIKKGSLWGIS